MYNCRIERAKHADLRRSSDSPFECINGLAGLFAFEGLDTSGNCLQGLLCFCTWDVSEQGNLMMYASRLCDSCNREKLRFLRRIIATCELTRRWMCKVTSMSWTPSTLTTLR